MSCIIRPIPTPDIRPSQSALESFRQNLGAYEPEFWELEYQVTPYLRNLPLDMLMRRYMDLVRNFNYLVSVDRYAIPSPSFLSSWYWHRKEHQTRLELHIRRIQPPVAPPQAVFSEPVSGEPRRPKYPNAGDVLYKYASDRWASDLFLRGETRLSSAGYYGRLNGDEARQDDELQKRNSLFGQTVTVTSADGRNIPVIGDVSVAHQGPDYYMFCVACDWDARLLDEFDVDRCVVITNTDAFADRIRSATAEKLDGWHFHHNPVEYFDPHEQHLGGYINHAMAKDFRFAYQREYRFVWMHPQATESREEHLGISIGALGNCAELWSASGQIAD